MNIQNIIAGCKQNERSAQRALFSHFAPYVYTICRRYAPCDEDAKENMQDCFLKILTKIELFDPAKGSIKSWISRICINESLNKIKSQSKIITMVNLDVSELQIAYQNDINEAQNTKQEMLIKAIQTLPEGYRNVLNLYIFERKSHKEIGKLLGIAEATSRSQLTRAKSILKRLIQKKKMNSYGT
ncbi:MAG: sigma-70 family RNA polymerase sigma factor [Bacteroidota bacterium]